MARVALRRTFCRCHQSHNLYYGVLTALCCVERVSLCIVLLCKNLCLCSKAI